LPTTNLDILTISYDPTSGNIRTGWPRYFVSGYADGDDEAFALAIDNIDRSPLHLPGVYVGGWAYNGNPTLKDAQLVFYDFNGGNAKEMHYGCGGCQAPEFGDDFINSLVVSPVTGDIFCTGAKWCGENQCGNGFGTCIGPNCIRSSYEIFTARFMWITDIGDCMGCSSIYPPNTFPCLAIDNCYCTNARFDGTVNDGDGIDVGNSVVLDPTVGAGHHDFVYATGYSQNNVGGTDFVTIKYNHSEGQSDYNGSKGITRGMWCTECYPTFGEYYGCSRAGCPTFNPDGYSTNIGKSIAIDASGNNIFVTGNSDYLAPHAVTIQYNSSSGNQVCVGEYYNSKWPVTANSIAVDGNSVYVAGSQGNYVPEGINVDFLVLKYTACNDGGDLISNQETQKLNGAPRNYSLSQNYPNPFNPSTTINYSIPRASNVTLKIYNTQGQLVLNISGKNREPGYYSEDINASSWASGIYFYILTAGDFKETKKMLLIK